MRQLDPGYSIEVDKITKDEWHLRMKEFDDASFYQTWSFGTIHAGERKLSHVLLSYGGKLAAMAQTRLYSIPRTSWGMAYISWGPMWRPKNEDENIDHLKNVLRALFNEYVDSRKYYLRISPKIVDNEATSRLRDVYIGEGFKRRGDPQETVVLDLSPPLETISQNVGRSWRNAHKKALRQQVQFVEGSDAAITKEVLRVAEEMKNRKNYYGGNQRELILANDDLPPDLRLHMIVCRHSEEPVAALGWPIMGTTGIPLVGGTANKGMKINASSLLWWKMIEFYKARGFKWLDTGGVNLQRNPGGFFFKTQLLGKHFVRPDGYIGLFDASKSPISSLFFKVLFEAKEFLVGLGRKLAKGKQAKAKTIGREETHD